MTIEREILELIANPDEGERLNDLADEFRRGRDATELLVLLDSENVELVSLGAWILDELPVALYSSDAFLSRLRRLTEHGSWEVRFNAFGALFPFLDPQDATTRTLIQQLLRDPNVAVRKSAAAGASQLFPTEQL